MKKIISLLLLLSIALSVFSLPALAEEKSSDTAVTEAPESSEKTDKSSDNAEKEASASDEGDELVNIATYHCYYDTEAKRVRVSGTLNSDVFADQNNAMLVVYAVAPGESEYDVVNGESKPLAEAPASIKFEFSFRATDIIDRYSRYAVFLRSDDGEHTLTTEAQYPEVSSTFETQSDKKYYKGLAAEYSSLHTEINAGTAIIPIYWDSFFSDSASSNLFMGENGEQFFFNKATIDALDVAVRSLSVSGTKIYFRFLKSSNPIGSMSSEIKYRMPDVYDAEVIKKIHSAITFLTERYTDEIDSISGFIIGKGWDNPEKYNYCSATSLEEYIDRCTAYAVVVANAARMVEPNIDIVIPLTGEGFNEKAPDTEKTSANYKNKFKTIVEMLMQSLDDRVQGGLSCSFLIDSHETPLGITNENIEEGINLNYSNPNGAFYAGNHRALSNYLSTISEKYNSCLKKYAFVWSPKQELSGNALAAAYAYSYYTLLSDNNVLFFAIDLLGDSGGEDIYALSHIMKHIDTAQSLEVTKNLAELAGKSSWTDIVRISANAPYDVKDIHEAPAEVDESTKYRGEFAYFDFSQSNLTENWHEGVGCKNIKIDYKNEGEKSFRADLAFSDTIHASELLYIYGYPENMIYTPFLRFRFNVSDTAQNSLYEVKFIFGSGENRAESSVIVAGNTDTSLTIDLSEYVHKYMIETIKVSVRSLDGTAPEATLWMYDIFGFSNNYSSTQLKDFILLERDKIRNPVEEEEAVSLIGTVAIPIAVVIVTGAIGFGLFASFRRDDKSNDSDGDDGRE